MDTHTLHRNIALLLSLGVLPACPAKEPEDPTDADTSVGPGSTDSTAGTAAPTTTVEAPTGTDGATTGPDATAGEETAASGTTGEPVPELCAAYAAKYVECYPRYAGMQQESEQYCAQYLAMFERMLPECVAPLEDLLACLSKLDCQAFMQETGCAAENDAFEKCNGEDDTSTDTSGSTGSDTE